MVDQLVQVSPAVMLMLPVLIALAQLLKTYEYIPSRWIPLSVVVLGAFGAMVTTDLSLVQAGFQGLVVGLMAIGAFSGVRSTAQG